MVQKNEENRFKQQMLPDLPEPASHEKEALTGFLLRPLSGTSSAPFRETSVLSRKTHTHAYLATQQDHCDGDRALPAVVLFVECSLTLLLPGTIRILRDSEVWLGKLRKSITRYTCSNFRSKCANANFILANKQFYLWLTRIKFAFTGNQRLKMIGPLAACRREQSKDHVSRYRLRTSFS